MPRWSKNTFFGAATVGERGQIVIPAEARKEQNIEFGDKVMVFAHGRGLLVLKAETVTELLSETLSQATTLEELLKQAAKDEEQG
ncbi:MAG: hypothetical protein DDT34_00077 [Firmicutes bacterium]|nr:hypothetical protein [Bacillota bacterium]MBT9152479.1 hypothetical protein [Bacillota bacterium]